VVVCSKLFGSYEITPQIEPFLEQKRDSAASMYFRCHQNLISHAGGAPQQGATSTTPEDAKVLHTILNVADGSTNAGADQNIGTRGATRPNRKPLRKIVGRGTISNLSATASYRSIMSTDELPVNLRIGGGLDPDKPLDAEDAKRLVFFEKLFFQVDTNSTGYLRFDELENLLTFICMDVPQTLLLDVIRECDEDRSGVISQEEFIDLCAQQLWNVPEELLSQAADNFISASANTTERNLEYWRQVAHQVDRGARFTVTAAYVWVMLWIFHVDLNDGYEQQQKIGSIPQSIRGIADVTISDRGIVRLTVASLVLSGFVATYVFRDKVQKVQGHAREIYKRVGTSSKVDPESAR